MSAPERPEIESVVFEDVLAEMRIEPSTSGITFVHVLRAMKLTAEKLRGGQ